MKTAILLVVLLALVLGTLLAWSYRAASIGQLMAYADKVAASVPACRSPAVLAALNGSLDRAKAGRVPAALIVARAFYANNPGESLRPQRVDDYAQREYWLLAVAGQDRLAGAYCAIGAAGRDYNLPGVGAIVGIRDIAHAQPHMLQALTDVYAGRIGWRLPPDEVRARFGAALSGR